MHGNPPPSSPRAPASLMLQTNELNQPITFLLRVYLSPPTRLPVADGSTAMRSALDMGEATAVRLQLGALLGRSLPCCKK